MSATVSLIEFLSGCGYPLGTLLQPGQIFVARELAVLPSLLKTGALFRCA